MARIVVTVVPIAGHVAPATGVVRELIARGHDVRVHTGAQYLGRFEALGARGIRWSHAPDFDDTEIGAAYPRADRRGRLGVVAILRHLFVPTAAAQARDLIGAHALEPFELIVADVMTLGGGLAAEQLGLPWVTLGVLPLTAPSADLAPAGLGVHPRGGTSGRLRDRVLRGIGDVMVAPVDRALATERATLGLAPSSLGVERALFSPWLVVVTGTPSLLFPRSDLASRFHLVGRLAPAGGVPAALPEWWPAWSDADGAIVLVTQGTLNLELRDLLEPAIDSLADAPLRVIATSASAPYDRPIPPNARVVPFAPFEEVLPRVALMVTNGGWGGVLEALSHGVPLIVAGRDLDKPEIAGLVSWSGAGVDLGTGRPKPRAVRTAVERVLSDPRFAEAARRIADELTALGGVERAVDLIEELLRTGAPVEREGDPWGGMPSRGSGG